VRGGRWVEKNASEARGGRRCARLRRAGEGAGAGERAERAEAGDSGAERGEGSSERQHRRWDCGNCIGGEEVAATLRDSGISLGLFSYVGYTTHLSSKICRNEETTTSRE